MKFGILAGGEGSRLVNEGVFIPKPLVSLCGEPMIYRLIQIFAENDADEISVFVNKEMAEVIKYLQSITSSFSFPIRICSGKTPSSFHSFARLVEFMNPTGKYIVTTVDTVFSSENMVDFANSFVGLQPDFDGMLGVTDIQDDEKPLFVTTDEDNKVTGFSNHPTDERYYISAGVYALNISSIPIIKLAKDQNISRMRNFQALMVQEGLKLKIFNMGDVIDIDHISDIPKGESLIESKKICRIL